MGNVTNDGYHTYVYDAENRVISSDSLTNTYTYDAFGRRIEQKLQGTKYDYVYGPGGIADLLSASGVTWSQLAGSTNLGIYANGTTNFYHQNWSLSGTWK